MAEAAAIAWPRPYFKATTQSSKVFFVCFGRAPFAEVTLDRARFGLPDPEVAKQIDLREHPRDQGREWYEGWWHGAFSALAQQDLGEELPLLTTSNVCYSLGLELPDRGDLVPAQTVWALSRWLCARGANVVLDVHAFRFRTRAEVESLSFAEADVTRDVKIVLESDPTRDGLHLMHTRGLCKFARPELMCLIRPDDAGLLGRLMNQVARTLMEGATAEQIRLRVTDGVELKTGPVSDLPLLESLGLEAAVELRRGDGVELAGIGRVTSLA
jgi:hypothetical protein